MTWTYLDTLLTNRDKVRLLIGDVDTTDQLITDEGIAFLITQEPNLTLAAAAAAETIAGGLARKVSRAIGDVSVSLNQKYEHYMELAKALRDRGYSQGAFSPYAGGISIADKDGVEDDSDRVAPSFTRRLGNHPGLGQGATPDDLSQAQ